MFELSVASAYVVQSVHRERQQVASTSGQHAIRMGLEMLARVQRLARRWVIAVEGNQLDVVRRGCVLLCVCRSNGESYLNCCVCAPCS